MVLSHKWFFPNCVKLFFVSTLNTSDQMVQTALKKQEVPGVCSEDRRGKHCTRPGKISENMKDTVREHIDYFACIESLLQERYTKINIFLIAIYKTSF